MSCSRIISEWYLRCVQDVHCRWTPLSNLHHKRPNELSETCLLFGTRCTCAPRCHFAFLHSAPLSCASLCKSSAKQESNPRRYIWDKFRLHPDFHILFLSGKVRLRCRFSMERIDPPPRLSMGIFVFVLLPRAPNPTQSAGLNSGGACRCYFSRWT